MFRKKKIVEMRTVLFVDDDEAILHSLERGLLDEPYNKLFAKSCKEALEILQQEEVHVIVTDNRRQFHTQCKSRNNADKSRKT